ncbi:MAG: site-specific DNA-methyltransferase [Bacteroidetes bacterium]|uniref:site-specific DNA-methyltransferase (adenine-specific) n=1 Tax=Candidatus Caccoplasma merdipullorum TaxID=2840718 RepID=A0A9D9E5G2_9BACT|nr:site-specific DNA-methyltransferase [Candidatus Caccoplasma merdipullorum]
MIDNNLLIKCDNIKAMQWLINNGYEGKIDLVYIDPPFSTGGSFSIDRNGRVATISKAQDSIHVYDDNIKGKEFIEFLKARVILIHKLLSNRGSLYLHIDYKIGHYVKVMLDEIFGIKSFRNDITRIKCNPKNFDKIGYGNIKDMILFYTKGDCPIWNTPKLPYSEQEIIKRYPKIDKYGRRYTTVPIHAPGETKNGETSKPFKGIYPPAGRHWRCAIEKLEDLDKSGLIEWSSKGNPRKINYISEMRGKRVQDIWEYKDPIYPQYPTQKNEDMLKLIIETSSNKDSIIMDCFCGSGTTLRVAKELGRKWIGIDNSDVAIEIAKNSLCHKNIFNNDKKTFEFIEMV